MQYAPSSLLGGLPASPASYHGRGECGGHQHWYYDEHHERQLPADNEALDEGEYETGEQLNGARELVSKSFDDLVHVTTERENTLHVSITNISTPIQYRYCTHTHTCYDTCTQAQISMYASGLMLRYPPTKFTPMGSHHIPS